MWKTECSGMYLYIELIIYLNDFAEGVNKLHKIRKFPHIPQTLQNTGCFGRLSDVVLIRLLPGTLTRGHAGRDQAGQGDEGRWKWMVAADGTKGRRGGEKGGGFPRIQFHYARIKR